MMEIMKIMETSFKRSCAGTAALSAPNPAAGQHDPCLHQRLLDTHGQVLVSLLWGHGSFLLGPGVPQVLLVPSTSLFPLSCVSAGVSLWVLCTQGMFEPSECLWQVWGLTLNMILPLLPSCWGFSFALGHGVSFLMGSNILLLIVVQQQVVILEFLQEKMIAHCSTLPSNMPT